VKAVSESAYQAVDNSLGDSLLELCAHMGDVCGDMRRNHLQVLLAWVAPLRNLSNPSPCNVTYKTNQLASMMPQLPGTA